MVTFLNDAELRRLKSAQTHAFHSPVPTRVISNGEFTPPPQSDDQRRVEGRIKELADEFGRRQGLDRRGFLASAAGMAAAFLAMNEIYGRVFDVSRAEAATPDMADERAAALSGQFIFDDQVHFVHDDFQQEGLLDLGLFAAEHWNPELTPEQLKLSYYKFENFVRQVFINSDTKVALLSGAPFDDPSWWLLPNAQIHQAKRLINEIAGTRRLLGHFVITPGQDGWMDKVDEALETMPPDAWKGYTIGDPLSASTRYPWRLDDEKLMYPFYEKAVAAGIPTLAIHKGLMPADYETSWKDVWQYNTHWDIAKAAKDWPQMNFVIYHACLQPFLETPDRALEEFEATGEIRWSSELARIPAEHGVDNVYAEIGTAFANSATANPRFAAALLGTLLKGMGADHVIWGTDSVWYGSPQWQIEALRRLEIPEDMRQKHGFAALGAADGLTKTAIFGLNSTKLYGLKLDSATLEPLGEDAFARVRHAHAGGALRDNVAYGYIDAG